MKKIFSLILSLTCLIPVFTISNSTVNATTWMVVPDRGLRSCLNTKYLDRKLATANINSDDMEKINRENKTIECEGFEIKNLKGLEYLTNASHFYLSNNKIEDLSPLMYLDNLYGFYASNNEISDTTPLKYLDRLHSLQLSSNNIEDITPLANIPDLTNLWINYNQITDLRAMQNAKGPLTNFTAVNQYIKKAMTVKTITANTIIRVYDLDGAMLEDVWTIMQGHDKDEKIFSGNWSGDAGVKFTGDYEIKVILSKPPLKIRGNNFEISVGTTLTFDDFIKYSNLKMSSDRYAFIYAMPSWVDLSQVNTSKVGVYPIMLNVPEHDHYSASSTIFYVTVTNNKV